MRKILKHFVALAVLALSVFAPCIAAKAVKPVVVDETQPVVIVEFSANKYIDFFTYKGYISNAGKKSGGGLLGMIASGIDKKVMSDSYTSLLTKNLIEELKVEQIVLEELANFPEIKDMVSVETLLSTKDYTKIKNPKDTNELRYMPVGNFKYFGNDKNRQKNIQNAEKTLGKKLGAKGFVEIYVDFGYYLSESDDVKTDFQKGLDKFGSGLDAIGSALGVKSQKQAADTGYLHPAVNVVVRIYDQNGVPFSFPYRYVNGEQIKGYETEKEAKKAKSSFDLTRDYYYMGRAVGEQSVVINTGKYDDDEFAKLYTEELVREAAKKAVLRAVEASAEVEEE